MSLQSSAFESGNPIPIANTCDAQDESPPLRWGEPPAGTRSFVLICDDPDAPHGTWVHWVLFNLPGETRSLAAAVTPREELESGAKQGRNDFGRLGYGGPCPPKGKPHRYSFRIYALDAPLALEAGVTKGAVVKAMEGHVLAAGELMGTYQRR